VQTLYAVVGGAVQTRQRTVQAETTAPPAPMTRRRKLRLAGIGVVVALLVFLVSSIFVPYRKLFRQLFERIVPFEPDKLAVDATAFQGYFTVAKKDAAEGGTLAVVTLQRSEGFPRTQAELQRRAEQAAGLSERLAVEALARGYVRWEMFGREGELLGAGFVRIADLRRKETVELKLPVPDGPHPARLVLTY
jgi:hypothetical protein